MEHLLLPFIFIQSYLVQSVTQALNAFECIVSNLSLFLRFYTLEVSLPRNVACICRYQVKTKDFTKTMVNGHKSNRRKEAQSKDRLPPAALLYSVHVGYAYTSAYRGSVSRFIS
jgi:hypothetical protein